MTTKPNWNNAPEWAKYLAMDSSGEWWWYENEPLQSIDNQRWYSALGGRAEIAELNNESVWLDTLESR